MGMMIEAAFGSRLIIPVFYRGPLFFATLPLAFLQNQCYAGAVRSAFAAEFMHV
jgi:hypothetical protein